MKMNNLIILTCFVLIATGCTGDGNNIKPYPGNPYYWKYKGRPVLLLGATDYDNMFQCNHLESHLDSLVSAGGNYIRNVMSDRGINDQKAFAMTPEGKYDLDKWNDEYWQRFGNTLKLAEDRDIIVQIELWNRRDHSRDEWLWNPYNPANNVNYTFAESGLDSVYPRHPGANVQPFFFTVPELDNNEVLLRYQNAFVSKLLSISLDHGNVLYCISNESGAAAEWATYWARFIRSHAGNREVQITEMWGSHDMKSDQHKQSFDHPEMYTYIDMSQNAGQVGYENWEGIRYVIDYISDDPRPVNHVKIYGRDSFDWMNRGMSSATGVETFFRNIIGGLASSRFHRPPYGMGLDRMTMNCIRTIRKIEETVKMWDIDPRMDLLHDNGENLAYLAAKEGESYVVYFTGQGSVSLDLIGQNDTFTVKWIDIENTDWSRTGEIKGGRMVKLEAISGHSSFAVLSKK
jgi:hypothetical protein